eukprot:ANDGO_07986.mRNA.1 hypothetical protein
MAPQSLPVFESISDLFSVRFDGLEGILRQMLGALHSHESRIANLEGKQSVLLDTVSGLKEDVVKVHEIQETVASKVSTLDNQVSAVQTTVHKIDSSVAQVQNSVQEAEKERVISRESSFTSVKAAGELESKLAVIQSSIDLDIKALQSKVAEMESRVHKTEASAFQEQNVVQDTLLDLSSRVETDVSSLKAKLDELVSSQKKMQSDVSTRNVDMRDAVLKTNESLEYLYRALDVEKDQLAQAVESRVNMFDHFWARKGPFRVLFQKVMEKADMDDIHPLRRLASETHSRCDALERELLKRVLKSDLQDYQALTDSLNLQLESVRNAVAKAEQYARETLWESLESVKEDMQKKAGTEDFGKMRFEAMANHEALAMRVDTLVSRSASIDDKLNRLRVFSEDLLSAKSDRMEVEQLAQQLNAMAAMQVDKDVDNASSLRTKCLACGRPAPGFVDPFLDTPSSNQKTVFPPGRTTATMASPRSSIGSVQAAFGHHDNAPTLATDSGTSRLETYYQWIESSVVPKDERSMSVNDRAIALPANAAVGSDHRIYNGLKERMSAAAGSVSGSVIPTPPPPRPSTAAAHNNNRPASTPRSNTVPRNIVLPAIS